MNNSRVRFKYALRYCRNNNEQIKVHKIARNFSQKNSSEFLKEINKINSKKSNKTSTIEGLSGDKNITEFWKNNFQKILTDVSRDIKVYKSFQ